jgi:hypothetical protein
VRRLSLVLVVFALSLPSAAQAASAGIVNGTVTFTAGAGEVNSVQVINLTVGTVSFREQEATGPTILAQGGCTNVDARRVDCTLASSSVPVRLDAGDMTDHISVSNLPSNSITLSLGDGDDHFLDQGFGATVRRNVFGDAGNDLIIAGPAGASVNGGAGNDILNGGTGADNLSATAGNDFISGGEGNDTLNGGTGDDNITENEPSFGALNGDDTINGGDGFDKVNYSSRNRSLRITLDGVANDGGIVVGGTSEADNVRADVEGVTGGKLADGIAGSNGDDVLRGMGGDDAIKGLAGDDTLDGGQPGTDNGLGADDLDGGKGADTLEARDAVHDTLSCGPDLDALDADLVDDKLPIDCESVTQGAIREGKNVRMVSRRLRLRRGSVRVRLACPRSVKIGCRGNLAITSLRRGNRVAQASARGRAVRYRIRAARSKVVRLRLSRADRRRLAHKKRKLAQLSSFEKGTFGKKVTVRVVRLR